MLKYLFFFKKLHRIIINTTTKLRLLKQKQKIKKLRVQNKFTSDTYFNGLFSVCHKQSAMVAIKIMKIKTQSEPVNIKLAESVLANFDSP